MPEFDGVNLVITLDPAPGGSVEIDLFDDVYEPWKDWMRLTPRNRKYPAAFRSDGGNPLSSIINQGSYIFLNNTAGWRIKPYEQDGTWYVTGNLAVEDTTLPAFVSTDGDYTAAILGLQPVTQGVTPEMKEQLEHASFNGGVSYLDSGPYTGTAYPNGTSRRPCSDVHDAYAIAVFRGFTTGYVIEDMEVPVDIPLFQFTFIGSGRDRSVITVPDAATLYSCTFIDAEVTGFLDGSCTLRECEVTNLSYVSGYLESCVLSPGTITLGGGAEAHFLDCYSGVPGVSTPIIDMGGSGQSLAMRNYNGGALLTNKTGPEAVSIDLQAGQVRVDLTTVTNGTIVVRGDGKLVDHATGNLILDGATNGSAVFVNETSNYYFQVMLDFMRKKLLTVAKFLALK